MKNFGLVKEVVEKVNLINAVLKTGNNADKQEDELDDLLATVGCYSPKLQARAVALWKKDKEGKAFKELEAERELAKEKFTEVIGTPLAEAIKAEIGEGKKLSRIRTQKKDFKGELIDWNNLPMGTDYFAKPLNDGKYSAFSVCGATFVKEHINLTEEDLVRIGFLSVCYDPIDNKYNLHNWKVTYRVEDETVTAEEKKEAENNLENAFDLL